MQCKCKPTQTLDIRMHRQSVTAPLIQAFANAAWKSQVVGVPLPVSPTCRDEAG